MCHNVWSTVLALAVATCPLVQPAFAQIEVKQNGDVVLGTAGGATASNTTLNGDATVTGNLAAPTLNAPNTAITGNVTLGTAGANPTSVTTVNGYLNAPFLSAPTTTIPGNVTLGTGWPNPTTTIAVNGNLDAPMLTAPTTSVTGNLYAPKLTAPNTTVTGNLSAPYLTASTTTVTGNLNAATLIAPTTTITGNASVTGNLTVTGTSTVATKVRFVASGGAYTINQSTTCTDMPGLSLVLPAATASADTAIVTLNVTSPYSAGNQGPGGKFCISKDGVTLATPYAMFSAANDSNFRMPTTLVVSIALSTQQITVKAQWAAYANSTLVTDSPSTLSAVIGTTQ